MDEPVRIRHPVPGDEGGDELDVAFDCLYDSEDLGEVLYWLNRRGSAYITGQKDGMMVLVAGPRLIKRLETMLDKFDEDFAEIYAKGGGAS